MRNARAHRGMSGRRVVSAFIATVRRAHYVRLETSAPLSDDPTVSLAAIAS
jgi:hypothetical protein